MDEILKIFERFRMGPAQGDQYEITGRDILRTKMQPFIQANRPIDFVMLGFPMKSSNDRDKVIGQLPDKAEEVSMENFNQFNIQVKEVYGPGVNVNIVSDGYIFNDLLGVEDKTVASYESIMKEMSPGSVKLFDMTDFFRDAKPEARQKIMHEFGITTDELQRRILFDEDVNYLYRGMSIFMEQELAVKSFPSKSQLHKAAKILTRKMMLRNEAYSHLVRKEFNGSIRLSMHKSINNGSKYSFQLIPGGIYSPWHCALVINKDDSYSTIHRKDAVEKGYQLVNYAGRPYYFQEV